MHQRCLSISELLVCTWNFFIPNIKYILAIAIVANILILLLSMPLGGVIATLAAEFWGVGNEILWLIMTLIILSVATAAIMITGTSLIFGHMVESFLRGEKLTLSRSFSHGLQRLFPLLGTSLIMGLIIILLMAFSIFLQIESALILVLILYPFYVYWFFMQQVVLLRRKNPFQALGYFTSVARGRWWRVLGTSLAFIITGLIANYLMRLPFFFLPQIGLIGYLNLVVAYLIVNFFMMASIIFFLNLDYLTYPQQPARVQAHLDPAGSTAQPIVAGVPKIMDDSAWGETSKPTFEKALSMTESELETTTPKEDSPASETSGDSGNESASDDKKSKNS